MRVFLLNPPTPDNRRFIREGRCTQESGVWTTVWPPLSLAMAAAVLEEAGHEVRVMDCPAEGVGMQETQKEIAAFTPQAVIWSTSTPSPLSGSLRKKRLLGLVVGQICGWQS